MKKVAVILAGCGTMDGSETSMLPWEEASAVKRKSLL